MKRLDRESLVLYSLFLILEDRSDARTTRTQLGNALVVSDPTINLYLCRLKMSGYIDRRKKRFAKEIKGLIKLTRTGRSKVHRTRTILKDRTLTEKNHNIAGSVPLNDVLGRLIDPIEKVFFLNLYNHNPSFDLVTFLTLSEMSRDDTNLINVLTTMEKPWLNGRSRSFPDQLFNASLYGNVDRRMLGSAFLEKGCEDALLLLAEAKMRMGRSDDALLIHDHLRSNAEEMSADQRLILTMDRATVLLKYGRPLDALKEVEEMGKETKSEVHAALLDLMGAFIKVNHLNSLVPVDHFAQSIVAFDSMALPLLASRAYDLRGMSYLKLGDIEAAEEDLLSARRSALKAGSQLAEARVLLDLSKLSLHNGKHDLSMSYLKRTKSLFENRSMLELISYTEFQMALVELDRGRSKQAVMHYRNCGKVAFPLPSILTLNTYRNELMERALGKGDEKLQNLIYTL
ncbi:MAG: hypothetical protein MUC62_07135 [Candidatus Thermoplasmatota archaeon]|jgi:tetratricopeptide (TPR) repeat protein|nr:hypothetical protein [Candidatus Thermoplasmatota archaeon]